MNQKATPKTEPITTTKATTATTETNNLQASLAGAKGSGTFFGWIWSNIIWIIVLIVVSAASYIAGRMSCKRNKK